MSPLTSPVAIQLWAPSIDVELLRSGLSAAGFEVFDVKYFREISPGLPLLLPYADPFVLGLQEDCDKAAMASCELIALLASLDTSLVPFRLVNLTCIHVPSIVGWCIQPYDPPGQEAIAVFPQPDPLQAFLALELLKRHPSLATVYIALEEHPLSSSLDCRLPDSLFLDRYLTACSWDSLLKARAEQAAFENELRELALNLGVCETQQLTIQLQTEQLQDLGSRLEALNVLRDSCIQNSLVIQSQQDDLEVLCRRLTVLEDLISRASHSSEVIQYRFAQLLA